MTKLQSPQQIDASGGKPSPLASQKQIKPWGARYPTKSEIDRALSAAAKLGYDVAGFEVGPRGIKVSLVRHVEPPADPFDHWKRGRVALDR